MPPSMRLALATGLLATVAAPHAAPIDSQGTWRAELNARDIIGNAVALDSASAASFWNSRTSLTWRPEPQSLALALTALAGRLCGRDSRGTTA